MAPSRANRCSISLMSRQSSLRSSPKIEYVDDEEAEEQLEPAELPDWLSELKPDAQSPEPTTPIYALFETEVEVPPVPADMPDWLRKRRSRKKRLSLESIFEPENEDSEPVTGRARSMTWRMTSRSMSTIPGSRRSISNMSRAAWRTSTTSPNGTSKI